jgi:hypothetical protein
MKKYDYTEMDEKRSSYFEILARHYAKESFLIMKEVQGDLRGFVYGVNDRIKNTKRTNNVYMEYLFTAVLQEDEKSAIVCHKRRIKGQKEGCKYNHWVPIIKVSIFWQKG